MRWETAAVTDGPDVVELFLAGAHVVAEAIADPLVKDAWDRPSVLEEQSVGSVAGHLARAGVWVVGDYLDGGVPEGPAGFESAGQYFAELMRASSPRSHEAIRERSATVASVGAEGVARDVVTRLAALTPRLRALDPEHCIAVTGGITMRLGDYLVTRIVEQTVHLDDLARSVERPPWPLPPESEALTIAVGAEVGRRRCGSATMIRALYRQGFADAALPVL